MVKQPPTLLLSLLLHFPNQFADRVDELKKEMAARGEVEIPEE